MKPSDLRKRIRSYEDVHRHHLPNRTPLVIRCDGRAFHTLTKNFERPWDMNFKTAMDMAAKSLCREISSTAIAYVESDEITVISLPYGKYGTQPWFDNNLQKICSVAASIAATTFTYWMHQLREDLRSELATFDARAFTVPREEVCNILVDRQEDCIRNSILGYGQNLLGKKALYGLGCKTIVDRCKEIGHDWNLCIDWQKYGRMIVQEIRPRDYTRKRKNGTTYQVTASTAKEWIVKPAIVFKENRAFVDRLVWPENEEGKYSNPVTI